MLANEMAPRPHNSGHWTIDACATSQFEQLVRAVCGLPLGAVDVLAPSRMENLIGDEADDWPRYLADPTARLHLYGKAEARPGRKMGHVTYVLPAAAWPLRAVVHDLTCAFSFSIFITSSMRRSRKAQVASAPRERSFSQ